MDYRDILSWTRARLQVPSIAVHRKYVEAGLMFGLHLSGYNQALGFKGAVRPAFRG